jgi:hypothetical protein
MFYLDTENYILQSTIVVQLFLQGKLSLLFLLILRTNKSIETSNTQHSIVKVAWSIPSKLCITVHTLRNSASTPFPSLLGGGEWVFGVWFSLYVICFWLEIKQIPTVLPTFTSTFYSVYMQYPTLLLKCNFQLCFLTLYTMKLEWNCVLFSEHQNVKQPIKLF